MVNLLNNSLLNLNVSKDTTIQSISDNRYNKINNYINNFSNMLRESENNIIDNQEYDNMFFEIETFSQDKYIEENESQSDNDNIAFMEQNFKAEEYYQDSLKQEKTTDNNRRKGIVKTKSLRDTADTKENAEQINKNKTQLIGRGIKRRVKFNSLNKSKQIKVKMAINHFKDGKITEKELNTLLNKLLHNMIITSNKTNKAHENSLKSHTKIKILFSKNPQQKSEIIKNKTKQIEKEKNYAFKNNNLKKTIITQNKDNNNKQQIINQKIDSLNKSKNNISHQNIINDKTNLNKNSKNKIKSEIKLDNIKMKFNTNQTQNNQQIEKQIDIKQTLSQNRAKIFESIAKNTKVTITQGKTQFSTMFRPEELGRVDLKFIVKDGKMNGKVILQSQEAADFFRSNVESLKAVFQKSNIEFGDLQIILAGQHENSNQQNGNGNKNFADNFERGSIMSIKSGSKSFEENSINAVQKYNLQNDKIVNITV